MGLWNLANHLLNFAAPAAAMALVLPLCARLMRPKAGAALAWRWQMALVFIAGLGALAAGLLLFGRDGKMLSYAALALVCATCQWLLLRGWKT